MQRKTTFQLVEENYNIQDEIYKIDHLFVSEGYFNDTIVSYPLYNLLVDYLFLGWKYRRTCVTIREYFAKANALLPEYDRKRQKRPEIDENVMVNYLEVIENFIKLYNDNGKYLFDRYNIDCNGSFDYEFCYIVEEAEKRLGLTKKYIQDRVILMPNNAAAEYAIENIDDEDVQWEMIRYMREDLDLAEKRKSLAYLATNLYIEEDQHEQQEPLKSVIHKAGNILNNLHIRHNNKTGKYTNTVLNITDEDEAIMLCDYAFNLMLEVVIIREQSKYEQVYKEFNDKQKLARKNGKKEQKNGR